MTPSRSPVLTPHGHLVLAPTADGVTLPLDLYRRLESAFARGGGHGLLELGLREVGTVLPADFAYWRYFAARYVIVLCTSAHGLPEDAAADASEVPPPAADALAVLANAAPPMPGGEYLNAEVLAGLWSQIDMVFREELARAKTTLQESRSRSRPWRSLIGKALPATAPGPSTRWWSCCKGNCRRP
jgi:hypothetical protein